MFIRIVRKTALLMLLSLGILLVLGACASSEKDDSIIVFGDAGWDSNKFHDAVAMFIGEAAYGLKTKEISGSTPIVTTGLYNGDIQVRGEVWVDTQPGYYEDLEDGKMVELGLLFDDNDQGFYVPRYMIEGDPERGIEAVTPDLRAVEDLRKYPEIFPDPDDPDMGIIHGCISSWETDKIMRKKYSYYGLDEMYNYLDPGTDAALSAAIAGAYERGEPIVAYYWEPTWLTGKYDMVLLEDAPYELEAFEEGKTAFPAQKVTICANPQFVEEHPEYSEFLGSFKTSSAMVSEALAYIEENDASYMDAAAWFLKNNDELLDEWLPGDKAEAVRKVLNE